MMIDEQSRLLIETNSTKEKMFDKYEFTTAAELEQIKDRLEGAIGFTFDADLVGIHKLFYLASCLQRKLTKTNIDPYICHAMIIIGWDQLKHRLILAHSVADGVKINAVDYFSPIKYCGIPYKTATKIVVYVPTNPSLRQEILTVAKITGAISTAKENRSKFSWYNMITSILRKQICQDKNPVSNNFVYFMADLLLGQKQKKPRPSKSNKSRTRSFFCTEYVTNVIQSAIILESIDKTTFTIDGPSKAAASLWDLTRDEVAQLLYTKLTDPNNQLYQIYQSSIICHKINSTHTTSPFLAIILDAVC